MNHFKHLIYSQSVVARRFYRDTTHAMNLRQQPCHGTFEWKCLQLAREQICSCNGDLASFESCWAKGGDRDRFDRHH